MYYLYFTSNNAVCQGQFRNKLLPHGEAPVEQTSSSYLSVYIYAAR